MQTSINYIKELKVKYPTCYSTIDLISSLEMVYNHTSPDIRGRIIKIDQTFRNRDSSSLAFDIGMLIGHLNNIKRNDQEIYRKLDELTKKLSNHKFEIYEKLKPTREEARELVSSILPLLRDLLIWYVLKFMESKSDTDKNRFLENEIPKMDYYIYFFKSNYSNENIDKVVKLIEEIYTDMFDC